MSRTEIHVFEVAASRHRDGDDFRVMTAPHFPVIDIDSCWEMGKTSALARPAREFQHQNRNPMRTGTREQGGLSYLPSSLCQENRGHEVARIGIRCAQGSGVPLPQPPRLRGHHRCMRASMHAEGAL